MFIFRASSAINEGNKQHSNHRKRINCSFRHCLHYFISYLICRVHKWRSNRRFSNIDNVPHLACLVAGVNVTIDCATENVTRPLWSEHEKLIYLTRYIPILLTGIFGASAIQLIGHSVVQKLIQASNNETITVLRLWPLCWVTQMGRSYRKSFIVITRSCEIPRLINSDNSDYATSLLITFPSCIK